MTVCEQNVNGLDKHELTVTNNIVKVELILGKGIVKYSSIIYNDLQIIETSIKDGHKFWYFHGNLHTLLKDYLMYQAHQQFYDGLPIFQVIVDDCNELQYGDDHIHIVHSHRPPALL